MKKLIKDHDNYHLVNHEQYIIATSDESILKCTDKQKLCIKNCQAIVDGYDLQYLEKLIDKEFKEFDQEFRIVCRRQLQESLTNMFLNGLNINNDKRFTKRDMISAYNEGKDVKYSNNAEDIEEYNFIQSLRKPEFTAIDVIVEMEDSKVVKSHIWDGSNDGELTWVKQPKLDCNGCLILKRK